MPLRLSEELRSGVDDLSPDLRAAAEAMGLGLRGQLTSLKPALTRVEDDLDAVELVELDLDHEGPPDPLSLSACLAAHRAYVGARGDAEGISVGALAIGRLLVWAQRAALLGAAPKVVWIGPEPRCPEVGVGQHRLSARCAVRAGDTVRRASAAVLITAEGGASASVGGAPED